MSKRESLALEPSNNYFLNEKTNHKFVSSGCTKLDLDLGGGYPLGRVVNIVGDSSTAKTALACEAITNFLRSYPDGRAAYRDAEAAFDAEYARSMGLPEKGVDLGESQIHTVEELYADLDVFLDERIKAGGPGIYVIDSLDALSDAAEVDRDFDEGTYGATKPKQISKLFRTIIAKLEGSDVLFLVISQVRDKIGVTYGKKTTRSGGRALQFYCTQVLWLAKKGSLKRTIKGQERVIGIEVRAQIEKNKVGLAHRETEFTFIFGYGVEDLVTSLNWLKETKRDAGIDSSKVHDLSYDEYAAAQGRVIPMVQKAWKEIETGFLPKRRKYSSG
jgi:recombination protein RecA